MTKYDLIFETLQERVNSGELTLEQAEAVNDVAYQKYVVEKCLLNKVFNKKNKDDDSDFMKSGIKSHGTDVYIYKTLEDDEKDDTIESLNKDVEILNSSLKKEIEKSDDFDSCKITNIIYELSYNGKKARFSVDYTCDKKYKNCVIEIQNGKLKSSSINSYS